MLLIVMVHPVPLLVARPHHSIRCSTPQQETLTKWKHLKPKTTLITERVLVKTITVHHGCNCTQICLLLCCCCCCCLFVCLLLLLLLFLGGVIWCFFFHFRKIMTFSMVYQYITMQNVLWFEQQVNKWTTKLAFSSVHRGYKFTNTLKEGKKVETLRSGCFCIHAYKKHILINSNPSDVYFLGERVGIVLRCQLYQHLLVCVRL